MEIQVSPESKIEQLKIYIKFLEEKIAGFNGTINRQKADLSFWKLDNERLSTQRNEMLRYDIRLEKELSELKKEAKELNEHIRLLHTILGMKWKDFERGGKCSQ